MFLLFFLNYIPSISSLTLVANVNGDNGHNFQATFSGRQSAAPFYFVPDSVTAKPKSIVSFTPKVPKLWHTSELKKILFQIQKLSIMKALNSNSLTHEADIEYKYPQHLCLWS